MATLGRAIAIAAEVHAEHVDKGGKAYILHPIRVMMRLRTDDEELMMIAILHDAVEDAPDPDAMILQLREEGFSDRVMDGLDSVTKRDGEDYEDFVKRCKANPDGRLVKQEDIKDNSDVTRLKGLRPKDFARLEKYAKAYNFLKED